MEAAEDQGLDDHRPHGPHPALERPQEQAPEQDLCLTLAGTGPLAGRLRAEATRLPDYRLTCFFVDRDHRRQGVAEVALRGALDLIAATGGGLVEDYPHDIGDQKVSSSFLYNGTRRMFEKAGFAYDRAKGEKNCVMTLTVPAS